jgi:hypothetical protein
LSGVVNNDTIIFKALGNKSAQIIVFVWEHSVGSVEQMYLCLLEVGKYGREFAANNA